MAHYEVVSQAGWIALKCDKRDGLEKVDSRFSSVETNQWKTSQIVRVTWANICKLLALTIFYPGN